MSKFDYEATAELFSPKSRRFNRAPIGYARFERAAEAIRHAIEGQPPELLRGTYLEVGEDRFDGHAIRQLYDSAAYPLERRQAGV